MPLTRHEHILFPRLPASKIEQHLAYALNAVASLGRDVNAPALLVLLRSRRITREVYFVEHGNELQFSRQPVDDGPIGCGNAGTCVDDQKQRVSMPDRLPGARDADGFDRVHRVTQTGGVDDIHGHALDLNGLAYGIACGAGNFSDDCEVLSGEPVEKRRFSYVRLAGQYDLKSAAKHAASTAADKRPTHFLLEVPQAPAGLFSVHFIDFLLGKIQGRFHQYAQLNEPFFKASDRLREFT